MAFNKDVAYALEMLRPTTLDEAFECVKRERHGPGEAEVEYVRAVEPQDARVEAYEREISSLKRKISSIEERLKFIENKSSPVIRRQSQYQCHC